VVFLHLLLFYDSYDSKRRGLLASILVLWSLRQQKPWSSCIYSCFMMPTNSKRRGILASTLFLIPTAAKGVVFLHLLLFYDLLYHDTILLMCMSRMNSYPRKHTVL
jgi:hypothetical protein